MSASFFINEKGVMKWFTIILRAVSATSDFVRRNVTMDENWIHHKRQITS